MPAKKEKVPSLRQFTSHRVSCSACQINVGGDCDCGFQAALALEASREEDRAEEVASLKQALSDLAEKSEYRGNSVSYIYDKMSCYRDQVDFAFRALRLIGADFSGADNKERAVRLMDWARKQQEREEARRAVFLHSKAALEMLEKDGHGKGAAAMLLRAALKLVSDLEAI